MKGGRQSSSCPAGFGARARACCHGCMWHRTEPQLATQWVAGACLHSRHSLRLPPTTSPLLRRPPCPRCRPPSFCLLVFPLPTVVLLIQMAATLAILGPLIATKRLAFAPFRCAACMLACGACMQAQGTRCLIAAPSQPASQPATNHSAVCTAGCCPLPRPAQVAPLQAAVWHQRPLHRQHGLCALWAAQPQPPNVCVRARLLWRMRARVSDVCVACWLRACVRACTHARAVASLLLSGTSLSPADPF